MEVSLSFLWFHTSCKTVNVNRCKQISWHNYRHNLHPFYYGVMSFNNEFCLTLCIFCICFTSNSVNNRKLFKWKIIMLFIFCQNKIIYFSFSCSLLNQLRLSQNSMLALGLLYVVRTKSVCNILTMPLRPTLQPLTFSTSCTCRGQM